MLPAVDPVTVAVVGALVVFAVLNRLRWRAKLAWFRRVQLEHLARADEDDARMENEGTRMQDDARVGDDDGRIGDDARIGDDSTRVEDDGH